MISKPIVYVEDTDDDAKLFLRSASHHNLPNPVTVLASAEEARTFFSKPGDEGRGPAAILVDLTLPKESGFDLINWLRGLHHLKDVPIFAISGKYLFDSVDRVYNAGANQFLVKPSKFEDWEMIIDRLRKHSI